MQQEEFYKSIEKIKEEYNNLGLSYKELLKLFNNYNKDEEIIKRDKKIQDLRMHSLVTLTNKEMIDDRDFRNDHYERCGNGCTFQYTLTGTGLGTIIEIKCPKCGELKDITDSSKF